MVKTIQESNLMNPSRKLGFPANENFSEQMLNLAKVFVGNAPMRNFAKNNENLCAFFSKKNAKFRATHFFRETFSLNDLETLILGRRFTYSILMNR